MKTLLTEAFLKKASSMLLFKTLKLPEVKKIMSVARTSRYENGEKIISKDDVSPFLFIVLEGTVNVTVPQNNGEQVFICSIGVGDVFGEAGIFLKVARTADVVAADTATLLEISRGDLIGFIRSNPEAGIKILMLIIYSLLKKLKDANLELAFERKADINQSDIDSIVEDVMGEI
ncbi:MAG: cyclic nucleotide-binding domain-containing protein [Spirochaetaceae bacterium]|nr:MAG: cyclic nucleotide-binding domain-containing protein [Spirochaetaceae bacterium]